MSVALALVCAGLSFIGSVTLLVAGVSLLRWIVLHVSRNRRIEQLGEWAVITGATDGIGKALALEIAKRNMSLCVIGRQDDKLKEVEDEIRKVPGFTKQIKCIKFDFARIATGEFSYDNLDSILGEMDVGILINNVGVSYRTAQFYFEVLPEDINDLVHVNVLATLRMTRLVYYKMIQEKRGAIVCIGSGSAQIPSDPLYAAYAGSKAAVQSFCRSLQVEAAGSNVLVQCQTPLLVTSKLSKVKKPSVTVPTPKDYAKSSIKCIEGAKIGGVLATPAIVSPYFIHTVILTCSNLVPTELFNWYRFSQTSGIRARYWKAMERLMKSQ